MKREGIDRHGEKESKRGGGQSELDRKRMKRVRDRECVREREREREREPERMIHFFFKSKIRS